MSALEDVNTLEQAAAYLKLAPAKVTRLRGEHKIGFIKQGNTVTYPREALEAFVKANQIAASPPNPHGLSDSSLARIRGRAA
jgi:excisionase family DNA binding protein